MKKKEVKDRSLQKFRAGTRTEFGFPMREMITGPKSSLQQLNSIKFR